MSSLVTSVLLVSVALVVAWSQETECRDLQTCNLGELGDEMAEDASLSLAQLRARQHLRTDSALIPTGNTYTLEAYFTEFHSYIATMCSPDGGFNFARFGSIKLRDGEGAQTGCMNVSLPQAETWFQDRGFDDCYQSTTGGNPELIIEFEAYEKEGNGDLCTYEDLDACHVKVRHTLSMSTIPEVKMNEWRPMRIGSEDTAHSAYIMYKLTLLTTTSTTTTTTTTVTTTTITDTSTTLTTATTTTTTTQVSECKVFGDPHIIGFDKGNTFLVLDVEDERTNKTEKEDMDDFQSGDFWLVKSPLVHIQGRYNSPGRRKASFLRVLAIGGPFLGNNTLVIGNQHAKIMWNGEEILSHLPGEFRNPYLIAKWHRDDHLVQDASRAAPGLDLALPLGVKMLVNRGKNGLGVSITMPPLEGGQDGQCGNYNGVSGDDTVGLISNRIGLNVALDELLFPQKTLREQRAEFLQSTNFDQSATSN